ncbi:hypothetical protein GCM10009616_00730 [Microlunatus lacustris]
MRIPFLPRAESARDLGIEEARLRFITETRGGSAFLLAGAVFWLGGAVIGVVVPGAAVGWVLYGGLAVPLVALVLARLQCARLFGNASYATLASLATLTELAALPVMFFLREDHPEVLPGVLMIADGAHLLILMWLHLDYTYFLAGLVKAVLGTLFLFGTVWAGSYPLQMAASGAVSVAAALLVWRDSSRTLSLHLVRPAPSGRP